MSSANSLYQTMRTQKLANVQSKLANLESANAKCRLTRIDAYSAELSKLAYNGTQGEF